MPKNVPNFIVSGLWYMSQKIVKSIPRKVKYCCLADCERSARSGDIKPAELAEEKSRLKKSETMRGILLTTNFLLTFTNSLHPYLPKLLLRRVACH